MNRLSQTTPGQRRPDANPGRGLGRLFRRYRWAPVLIALTVALLGFVSRFHSPHTGFTSLLLIGDELTPSKALLDQHPYVFKGTNGYDGQAYVQIALDPLLRNPGLVRSVDALGYRARRIFIPACAWLAGLGHPAWIVQAYALSNVFSWLLLGILLLHWLPPDSPQNVFRWAGILFTHGLCTSLRCSLTDGPGLTLLALGILLLETGRLRGALGTFAATILSRETYVLNTAAALIPDRLRDLRAWRRAAWLTFLTVLPLLVWMAYVRFETGAPRAEGARNFEWPGLGYLHRWHELLSGSDGRQFLLDFRVVGILSQVALTVQFLCIVLRPQPRNAWWRVGAVSALLGCVLGPAVWEGFPGAALRVLLPMTVAFNLLLPRGRRWIPLLLIGNLTFLGGLGELRDAPVFSAEWQGERGAIYATSLDVGHGWYYAESNQKQTWRWCRGTGELVFTNHGTTPTEISLSGRLSALSPRSVVLRRGNTILWRSATFKRVIPFHTPTLVIPPGVTRLELSSDQPLVKASPTDSRLVSFAVYDLSVRVQPAP